MPRLLPEPAAASLINIPLATVTLEFVELFSSESSNLFRPNLSLCLLHPTKALVVPNQGVSSPDTTAWARGQMQVSSAKGYRLMALQPGDKVFLKFADVCEAGMDKP